ncbi:MAG: aspartate/glutamate racemase family protein [Alphaproteobacteria bacterium]|nr:aspartate/glutamate racemase family protein [Alphaproteobacteria bacterium]
MRIYVINPNTTASMTDTIAKAAKHVAAKDTEIIAMTSTAGAVSIECHYDEAMSIMGLAQAIKDANDIEEKRGNRAGIATGRDHAFVIACFGDPGLLAVRELTAAPVLGIAEAAMHAASFLATGFSVVTTLGRTRVIAEHLVRNYGMEHHCRRVRAIDLPVLELENPASDARGRILAECQRALAEDNSAAIVLGCAGMADLVAYLSDKLGVPVIDGVTAAVKFAEALVGLGLGTSKKGDLAFPLYKPYKGTISNFAPGQK